MKTPSRPDLYNLLPGDTVVCGAKTYKVAHKLNIELSDVPQYCEEVASLDFIDKLTHAECQAVYNRLRDRGKQLRTEDPLVYGVRRVWKGTTKYHTRAPGMGWRQLLARDLEHSALWLCPRRKAAEDLVAAMTKDTCLKSALYEVFEIPKVKAVKLPCYKHHYHQFEEMTGETT